MLYILFLMLGMVLPASSSEKPPQGYYELIEGQCDNGLGKVKFKNLERYIKIQANTHKEILKASNCKVTRSGLKLNIMEDSFYFDGGVTSCSPANCVISYEIINELGDSYNREFKCPGDFGKSSSNYSYTNGLIHSAEDCKLVYKKK